MAGVGRTALKIGVLGAGSIGCYVGGRLAARGERVTLVGRPRLQAEIARAGLTLRDVNGDEVRLAPSAISFEVEPERLGDSDVVLCSVKSGQTESAARELQAVLAPGSVVISLQNGIGNALLLRRELPAQRVLAGIVSFNVVSSPEGVFTQGTSGPLIIEQSDEPRARQAVRALESSGFAVETPREIERHQWAKLLMNLGNAVSALSGAPTRELILSPGYRKILAALIAEALSVLRAAGVRPAGLKGVPVSWLVAALGLPTPLVRLIARAQLSVNAEARSSMWEDLTRGRTTEIEYLNGEIVQLARAHQSDAPLNRRVVQLVHEAEARGAGSPGLAADVLWRALTDGYS